MRAGGLASAGAVLSLGRSTPATESTVVLNLESRPDNPRNLRMPFALHDSTLCGN